MRLPYSRQSINSDDVRAVVRALKSDYITTGQKITEFETALSRATGAPFVSVLSSGTAALHAAYAILGLGPGDEVVMPPLTFAATANAALYLGARPVFADVDHCTGLLDPSAASAAVTPRTRAIVGVDYAGLPVDYRAIRERVSRKDIVIIADAAHSLGAAQDGCPVGTLADLTTFSFHPVKSITTGEGGAVATADATWHARINDFRSHGIVRDHNRLSRVDGPWYHEMQHLGYNYRLTDFQCALGVSQLGRLDRFLGRRRAIALRYDRAFAEAPGLQLPGHRLGAESAHHLYVLRVNQAGARRAFFSELTQAGLSVQVHYIPVYWHPHYQRLGYARGLCPTAEDFYQRAVSIPIFPSMTNADVDRVIAVVRSVAHRLFA